MVNKLFQRISDIIKSDFKNSFSGGKVVLQDSTSKQVKINKTGQLLCIQPDKKIKGWKNNFPYFTSLHDLCDVADHLIFYPKANTLFVFIVELKSTNTTGAINQVRASFELSKYICGTAKRLLNYPTIDIKYRGLIFSHKIISGTTKPQNLKYNQDKNTELMYRHLQSGHSFDLDVLSQ